MTDVPNDKEVYGEDVMEVTRETFIVSAAWLPQQISCEDEKSHIVWLVLAKVASSVLK